MRLMGTRATFLTASLLFEVLGRGTSEATDLGALPSVGVSLGHNLALECMYRH